MSDNTDNQEQKPTSLTIEKFYAKSAADQKSKLATFLDRMFGVELARVINTTRVAITELHDVQLGELTIFHKFETLMTASEGEDYSDQSHYEQLCQELEAYRTGVIQQAKEWQERNTQLATGQAAGNA